MTHFQVFTDASVNTLSKVGYGAYLVISDPNISIDTLQERVKTKRFEQTSSTKLELQILLWSLQETIQLADNRDISLTIYSDCQNIIGLPDRRRALEQRHYLTSKNKLLNNHELYQEFYRLTSNINCKFIKVVGHKVSSEKDKIDRVFTLVDKASRRALRAEF